MERREAQPRTGLSARTVELRYRFNRQSLAESITAASIETVREFRSRRPSGAAQGLPLPLRTPRVAKAHIGRPRDDGGGSSSGAEQGREARGRAGGAACGWFDNGFRIAAAMRPGPE